MNEMYPDYQMMQENPMMVYPMSYDNVISSGYPVAGHYINECLVKTIQDCEATCEHMTNHLKKLPDFQVRVRQAVLLRDCADICGLTAKYVARGAIFARQAAALCACICEVCGNECARFPDQMSQNCARVCMYCARECRAFAGM
ncbi:MAG: four-helix bundle copper-binding protein [Clostridia bacterium]